MDEEEKMDLMKLTVRALAWSRPLSRGWSSHCSPLHNLQSVLISTDGSISQI